MKREDIEHLAVLSRIALCEGEAEELAQDMNTILEYVSEVNSITGDKAEEKKVPELYNVMRDDVVTNTPGAYTEALLDAAPERVGRYVKVKKILGDKSS